MRQESLLGRKVKVPAQAGSYRTLYADPPWPERGGGKIKRGADRHYALMPVAEILAMPFGEWGGARCPPLPVGDEQLSAGRARVRQGVGLPTRDNGDMGEGPDRLGSVLPRHD